MNLQSALKVLLASSVAACCITVAHAQVVDKEITATIGSLQGPNWGSGAVGQGVTLDFTYDSSQQSTSFINNVFTLSWPILSASIVGGPFGSGTDLEPNGPGSGTAAEGANFVTGAQTLTFSTNVQPPSPSFTGNLFGFSYISDGINTTLDVVRSAFDEGRPDSGNSGQAVLGNVSLGSGTTSAPEIDGASTLSALTLLLGAIAIMRGKKLAKAPAA